MPTLECQEPHVSERSSASEYISLSNIFKIAFPGHGRFFTVIAQILDSFIDESSDQEQKDVLCVAAFLTQEQFWKSLEERWVERLHRDGVEYFRASDCKAVRGAFEDLRRIHRSFEAAKKVADEIRADLESLLLEATWIGFSIGVVIPEYQAVLQEYPISRKFYHDDPTVAAYSQIMYDVVRTVRRKNKNLGVAFAVDASTYSERIMHAFEATKVNHPVFGRAAKTCAPFDDKETPALQMADLIANVSKDIFLTWRMRGARYPKLGKWHNHIDRIATYDAKHMLRSLAKTLRSPRLAKGTLAPQFTPKPTITKRERKQQRRKSWQSATKP